MRRRSMYAILLMLAFLLSAWSNVIAAAFCPRYQARNCLVKPNSKLTRVSQQSCHHEIADMQMDDMIADDSSAQTESTTVANNQNPTDGTESSIDETALDRQNEPCGHCWMHSQPTSGSTILAALNPTSRSVEVPAPLASITIALSFPNPGVIEPFEHSPPGNSFPRHILINVFRI